MNVAEIKHSALTDLYPRYMENKTEEAENSLWAAIIHHLRQTYEYKLTGDNDLLSNAIEKVRENLHRFNPEQGKLASWLSVVIRNAYLDMLRSSRPNPIGGSDEVDEAWQKVDLQTGYGGEPRWLMTSYAPTEEQWGKIKSLVDRCIISSMLAHRTLAQAANECGISKKTARNRLSLVKNAVRKSS